MAERCPKCNAEYGSSDAYCTECGTPRRVRSASDEVGAELDAPAQPDQPVPTDEADGPDEGSVPLGSTLSDDENDFIPLVIPPQEAPRRDRRAIAAVLFGILLIGALVAAAWFLIGANDDDDGDAALDRQDVPVWVAGGSPEAATPEGDVVAGDNVASAVASTPATLPIIAPGEVNSSPASNASPQGTPESDATAAATPSQVASASAMASTPITRESVVTVAATPSPQASPTVNAPQASSPGPIAATPSVTPTAGSTPTRTSSPEATVRAPIEPMFVVPSVSPDVLSASAADALVTLVDGVEPPVPTPTVPASTPGGAAGPTEPAGSATPPLLPAGDGTGGALPSTELNPGE